jgi:uncharacterized protein (DUF2164 family)
VAAPVAGTTFLAGPAAASATFAAAQSRHEVAQMSTIDFDKDEKAVIVRKIQLYFSEELKQQIGRFDAEFLLDFFSRELGVYYYNRGLQDAQAALSARLDELQDVIYQLEQPTDFRK